MVHVKKDLRTRREKIHRNHEQALDAKPPVRDGCFPIQEFNL